LKNILKAKAAHLENKKKNMIFSKLETIAEKPALVKLVSEFVQLSEVEDLLSNSKTVANNNGPASSSSRSGSTKYSATSSR
jgi:hypothetical protein